MGEIAYFFFRLTPSNHTFKDELADGIVNVFFRFDGRIGYAANVPG